MSPATSSKSFDGRLVLRNQRDDIERAERAVLAALEAQQYGRASVFAVRLALEEALSNAFKHGNKNDPAKSVTLDYHVEPDMIRIEVEDQGEGFDPESIPDPTALENVEIPCGRGLTLMRAYMSDVEIQPPGNRLRMIYRRPA